MSRVIENLDLIRRIADDAQKIPTFYTYDDVIARHFATMNSILVDISKSLAVIADSDNRKESE